MGIRSRMELSKERYNEIKHILLTNGTPFQEQKYGSRKKLWAGGKFIGSSVITSIELEGLTTQQFGSFLAQFTKNLYKQFRLNDKLYDQQIVWRGLSRNKNNAQWKKIEDGEFFYNLDLSSAYWQVAHKLGYIDDKLFIKYMLDDKYKAPKRLCISFLARPNKMTYQSNNETIEIHCDNSALQRVYDNIRNELYCVLGNVAKEVEWIEYSIDGITVPKHEVKKVEALFSDYLFKKTLCMKIDNNTFRQGSKLRTWRKAIRIKNQ